MSQVSAIDRTVAQVGTVIHENYVNKVWPLVEMVDPFVAMFTEADGGFDLVGEKLVGAYQHDFSGGFIGTGGYIPDSEKAGRVRWETTPTRLYIRRAVDRFMAKRATKPGAFEDYIGAIMAEQVDAIKRGQARHIHGSNSGTVCTFVSRTSATVLVVDAGYGVAGVQPTMFVQPGMTMALLDANDSYAVIGAAVVTAVAHTTSSTTATITFATDIDTSSTGADGDPLVFCTTADESATRFETERSNAPNGLLDIIDPSDSLSAFMGITEASYPRFNPIRRASVNFGHIEIMEFLAEIAAKSTSEVNTQTHVITMQEGVKIELAKGLLPYQQQDQLGRELRGGWKSVNIAGFNAVTSNYHLPEVLYAICPEEIVVANLDGDPSTFAEDGSERSRLADYDGYEWFVSHYVQRWCLRRNRLGALTGISNTNASRYVPVV